MTCADCNLTVCACMTGRTRVTAAGETAQDARSTAEQYLTRRGYQGDLLRVRRRRTPTMGLGLPAWEMEFDVRRVRIP